MDKLSNLPKERIYFNGSTNYYSGKTLDVVLCPEWSKSNTCWQQLHKTQSLLPC